jgi:hypothetical protein
MDEKRASEQESKSHETRDIYVGKVTLAAIGLVIFMGLGALIAYFTFEYLVGMPVAESPQTQTGSRRLPPLPRLQVQTTQDLESMLDDAEKRLNSYGWIDQSRGLVHIPIDRAMDLIVKREQSEQLGRIRDNRLGSGKDQ